jgi:hypothetical protein
MTIMNSNMPMKLKLKSGAHIGLPIMFLSLGKLWPQLVQWQFLALVRQVEAKMPLVVEPLEVVEQLGAMV